MKKLNMDVLDRTDSFREMGYFEIDTVDGPLHLPVYIIQNGKGPRITLVGAQHSCEYSGSDALIKLIGDFDKMNLQEISGSVVMIPVANVVGYPYRAWCVSQFDGTNLNRSYPGDPEGNISERIAHTIWGIVKKGDYVLDLHGGDQNEYIMKYAEMHVASEEVMRKSLSLAACFNLDTVLCSIAGTDYAYPDYRSLYGLAQSNGIPASIIEAGSVGISDPESLQYFYEGLKKVFVRLGILDGKDQPLRRLWTTQWVSCIERPVQGVFTSFVGVGEKVKQGDLIGEITDYHGNMIDSIESPRTGIVSLVHACRGMNPDDLIYMIIDEERGEYVEI